MGVLSAPCERCEAQSVKATGGDPAERSQGKSVPLRLFSASVWQGAISFFASPWRAKRGLHLGQRLAPSSRSHLHGTRLRHLAAPDATHGLPRDQLLSLLATGDKRGPQDGDRRMLSGPWPGLCRDRLGRSPAGDSGWVLNTAQGQRRLTADP